MSDHSSVTHRMTPSSSHRVTIDRRPVLVDSGLALLLLIVVLGAALIAGPPLSIVHLDGGALSVAGE